MIILKGNYNYMQKIITSFYHDINLPSGANSLAHLQLNQVYSLCAFVTAIYLSFFVLG